MKNFIPIAYIPCKKIKLLSNNDMLKKELDDHYVNCEECEIVNNNKMSVGRKFWKDVLIARVKECAIEKIIKNYHSLNKQKNYFFPHNQMYIVDDKKSVYDKTIFIVWSIET